MSYRIALCSLGCAKNLVDSERILAILKDQCFEITDQFEEADVVIVNTCGFIESAKKESIDTIIEYAALKKKNCKALVVTGCLVQKYKNVLAQEIPEVDLWLGTLDFETIGQRLTELMPHCCYREPVGNDVSYRRILTTPNHWAYVKIAEGCSNHCTFCTIPQLRGPYVSRPREEILAEVRQLIQSGVKEIILLAQDTTVYGKDLYGRPMLQELLEDLVKENLLWIRVLYSYPARMDEALLRFMAREEKICTYLDIPMQHSEDHVLRSMGRPERRESLRNLLAKIREIDSDFVIRSTFIVGFPGETEEDFQGLCAFWEESVLDWVGVFPYSREEDTPAAEMAFQISEENKEARYDYAMSFLSRCSARNLEKWLGRTVTVLVEGEIDGEEDYPYFGRTSFQAPDVDGIIYLKTKHPSDVLKPGDVVKAKVTSTDVYDLMGEIL